MVVETTLCMYTYVSALICMVGWLLEFYVLATSKVISEWYQLVTVSDFIVLLH